MLFFGYMMYLCLIYNQIVKYITLVNCNYQSIKTKETTTMTVFVNMKDNDDNSTMGVATQVD